MQPGEASVTAQRVAAYRVAFPRLPADGGEPGADDRLTRDVAGTTVVDHSSPMARYLAGRTSFVDRVVVASLDAGLAQVVVAGAGYDGRSLRYARPGVRWFEIDHPATQQDKLDRLQRLGIATSDVAFVAADFTTDDVAVALAAGGHDRDAPSLFVCEGVAVYLETGVLEALVRGLRAAAAPGSRLALTLATGLASDARREAFRGAVAAVGEPARNSLTVEEASPLLLSAGWSITGSSGPGRSAGFVVLGPI